jgi:hypothetical protein
MFIGTVPKSPGRFVVGGIGAIPVLSRIVMVAFHTLTTLVYPDDVTMGEAASKPWPIPTGSDDPQQGGLGGVTSGGGAAAGI